MTQDSLILEMLKATTLALRIALGHIETPYMKTAHAIMTDVIIDSRYRDLTGAERAAIADAGTAIVEASLALKKK